MNINQLHQNNSVSQVNNQNAGKVIKNGSQVLVRILAGNGNNKYEAIVSGVKVQVTAKNPLKPGDVFIANANSKDGKILITPNKDTSVQNFLEVVEGKLLGFQLNDINAEVKNPQINNLLQSLGLFPNNLSLSIFLQMKQLGRKIDSSLIYKIYKQAIKFKGKEKKAAELMVLLNQKGINFSDEDIIAILNQLEESDINYDDGKETEKKDDCEFTLNNNFINGFINQILDTNNKIGVFTIMNHLGWKRNGEGNGSWIVLPFEISEIESKNCIGNGNLKIYLDQLKKFKKMLLYCEYNEKKINVICDYSSSLINIKVNVENSEKLPEEICRLLKKNLKSEKEIKIDYVDKELIENFASGLENIVMLGGTI